LFSGAERGFRISAISKLTITHISGGEGRMENDMVKRHYLTGVAVFLSLVAGSAAASAAEIGTNPKSYAAQDVAYQYRTYRPLHGYRGFYDYAGPPAFQGYGYGPAYEDRWDPYTWSTGNGYY
jgi:hypothetical protein